MTAPKINAAAIQMRAMLLSERKAYKKIMAIRRQSLPIAEQMKEPQFIQMELTRIYSMVLLEIYEDAINRIGSVVLSGFSKCANFLMEKKNEALWLSFAEQWFTTQGLKKAVGIATTHTQEIQQLLLDDITRGLPVAAKNLQELAKISRSRAMTISKTETHGAAMYASVETARQYAKETGLNVFKVWNATFDNTRPDHEAADGQRVQINEMFEVGGELMDRPADPSASAAQVINCSCVLTYEDDF